MRIDIEEVIQLQLRRNELNAVDIKYVEFYKDSKKLEIDPALIEDWHFVGLSNTDFVMMELKDK